MMEVTEALTWQ